MNNRTKHTNIPTKVKQRVWERDNGECIFCHSPNAFPEAHIIPRSHNGRGIEENIVTVCRICHGKMDNSSDRQFYLDAAKSYVRSIYPDWNEKMCTYDKWGFLNGKQ